MMTNKLEEALEDLALLLNGSIFTHHFAPKMTCYEADTLARVMRHSGHPDTAHSFLISHIKGDDDENDRHYNLTGAELGQYIAELDN